MNSIFLASYFALWLLVVLLLGAFAVMARQVGLLHRRIIPTGARMTNAGPQVGEVIPSRTIRDINGRHLSLGGASAKPSLVTFLSVGCDSCSSLAPALRSLWRHERNQIDFLIVSLTGTEEENRSFAESHDLIGMPYVLSGQLAREFKVLTPPYSIFLSAAGEVMSKGIVNRLEHLESLLNAAEMHEPSMESYMSKRLPDSSVGPVSTVSD
jgi:methylamine dehydrogenase accessory protein MauD